MLVVGNVAAILMGQLAQLNPDLFADKPVLDQDGVRHAGIKNSTVVLKAGFGQITNLAMKLSADDTVESLVFTAKGQSLSNRFEEYAEIVSDNDLATLKPVGLIMTGEESVIRQLTKKFSILS
ncbi:DUF2000 family protein [Lactiplantibacillus mudanjiangensis]|uniref:DUF2000 domain-containing protein n=1 Tax=Lactiplantibacillus mudanjiangensis TaxID=1296538 RepID=A0A660DYB6_9LACO|nr:DUF2000 family protein [Lactiplantibacillus mudanjiangensis]VDG19402.1 hypothetical protein MUDAN_BIHEEGNE_01150 [Lactiplantibacillus mudanjiangensis]VDG24715.1 hypothetical protein MUDAN_IGPPGNFN_02902 [Lactiplantibacillus mudanjiangensis]VDG28016.1 hypothetical protein MUDAN_MDHGFNIF_02822 [Lactiplantibacillus mudanjiangensis]